LSEAPRLLIGRNNESAPTAELGAINKMTGGREKCNCRVVSELREYFR
jgi:hypothetical protein